MKKVLSIILAVSILLSMTLFSGCSTQELAAVGEELSLQYEWESFLTTEYDNEILTISRRHDKGFMGIHCTYYKITIYEDDVCTYFYTTIGTPCKNGIFGCDGRLATLKDACALDPTLDDLYPYIEKAHAYETFQNMLMDPSYGNKLSDLLFKDLIRDYFDDQKDAIISDTLTSSVGKVCEADEFISMLAEIGLDIQEANETQENTEDENAVIEFIAPYLTKIKDAWDSILVFFGIKHQTANSKIEQAGGLKNGANIDVNYEYSEAVRKLHEQFKTLMDEKYESIREDVETIVQNY